MKDQMFTFVLAFVRTYKTSVKMFIDEVGKREIRKSTFLNI